MLLRVAQRQIDIEWQRQIEGALAGATGGGRCLNDSGIIELLPRNSDEQSRNSLKLLLNFPSVHFYIFSPFRFTLDPSRL